MDAPRQAFNTRSGIPIHFHFLAFHALLILTYWQVDPQSKILIRSLGHVHLCGVLHVAWQTKNGVDGQHMISLLYRDCLVLATVEKLESVYKAGAIIFFNDIRVEEADNGKGKYPGVYNGISSE